MRDKIEEWLEKKEAYEASVKIVDKMLEMVDDEDIQKLDSSVLDRLYKEARKELIDEESDDYMYPNGRDDD